MSSARKNVYLSERTLEQLDGDGLSSRITQIVDRYSEMVRRIRIEKKFTEAERNLIRDACLSWLPEPAATIFGGVALEVEDSLPDRLDAKWQVDAQTLLTKLAALSPGEEVALVDWIESTRAK